MVKTLDEQKETTSQLGAVSLIYKPGNRINLAQDLTVRYTGIGSATLDNLVFEDVTSMAIQDRNPMWMQPTIQARLTYAGIAKTKEGPVFSQIILQPYDTEEALEALITATPKIPEIDALRTRKRIVLHDPEIVRVNTASGMKVYRNIDFVRCKAGGLSIEFETSLPLPKDAVAAYAPSLNQ